MRTQELSVLAAALVTVLTAFSVSAKSFDPVIDVPGDEDTVAVDTADRGPLGGVPTTRVASVNEAGATACHPADPANPRLLFRTPEGLTNRSSSITDFAKVLCGVGTDFRSDNNGEVTEFGVYLTNSNPFAITNFCIAYQGRGAAFSNAFKSRSVNPTPPAIPQLLFWKAADFGVTAIRFPIVVECSLRLGIGVNRMYAEYRITQ